MTRQQVHDICRDAIESRGYQALSIEVRDRILDGVAYPDEINWIVDLQVVIDGVSTWCAWCVDPITGVIS